MWGPNKKCPSGFAQPIGRTPGEQDLPWDAVSITQIQRTGLENPDFGSVFVRGRVASGNAALETRRSTGLNARSREGDRLLPPLRFLRKIQLY